MTDSALGEQYSNPSAASSSSARYCFLKRTSNCVLAFPPVLMCKSTNIVRVPCQWTSKSLYSSATKWPFEDLKQNKTSTCPFRKSRCRPCLVMKSISSPNCAPSCPRKSSEAPIRATRVMMSKRSVRGENSTASVTRSNHSLKMLRYLLNAGSLA